MNACKIIAVANQKGGVAKSTTSYNFAACLSEAGKRVLLVDLDPQASLTILYGIDQPDELEFTVCDLMKACAEDKEMAAEACILHDHTINLIPSSIELSTLEISLVGVMESGAHLKAGPCPSALPVRLHHHRLPSLSGAVDRQRPDRLRPCAYHHHPAVFLHQRPGTADRLHPADQGEAESQHRG